MSRTFRNLTIAVTQKYEYLNSVGMFKLIADNQQAVLATSRESLQLVQDALQEIEEVMTSNDYVNDKIQI